MADPSDATLSAAERAAFARDGFVLPRAVVGPSPVAALTAALATMAPVARLDDPASAPWRACAEAPALRTLIAPLLGAEAVPWRCVLRHAGEPDTEPPGWRSDDSAWPARPGAVVAVRLALDRADRANGCLLLLPRSHERLVRALRNARVGAAVALAPDAVDPAITVAAVRDPGMLTLYDPGTLVCAPANPSGRRRAAVVFYYLSASARAG